MKKILLRKCMLACLVVALCFSCLMVTNDDFVYAETVGGIKYKSFTADSLNDFDVYSCAQESNAARVVEGKLVTTGIEEQKLIYTKYGNLNDFEVSADFSATAKGGAIEAGFYLYAAEDVESRMDGISAVNVNIEKDAYSNTLSLRIHEFDYKWKGCKATIKVRVKREAINLRVVSNDGVMSIYMFGEKLPTLVYNVGATRSGNVGFRVFKRGVAIDNFRLYSTKIPVDYSFLNAQITSACKIDSSLYTAGSCANLTDALNYAESARDFTCQKEVDAAIEVLTNAVDSMIKAYSFESLSTLIANFGSINAAEYTFNTYESLRLTVEKAKLLTQNSSQEEISGIASTLQFCYDKLVKYIQIGVAK